MWLDRVFSTKGVHLEKSERESKHFSNSAMYSQLGPVLQFRLSLNHPFLDTLIFFCQSSGEIDSQQDTLN